jgi:hypothetical protein
MKRIAPLRQSRRHGADVEREPKPWAVALASSTLRPLQVPSYAGSTSGRAVAKSKAYRDRALLDMAENRPCLLLVPGVCNHRVDTTVACHSNLGIHGKAGARKADDCHSVHGCSACHAWLDTDRTAPAALKERVYMEAHLRMVLVWRQVGVDAAEPERFRSAARRALEHLNATPIGDTP